jgi:hypothetical protein
LKTHCSVKKSNICILFSLFFVFVEKRFLEIIVSILMIYMYIVCSLSSVSKRRYACTKNEKWRFLTHIQKRLIFGIQNQSNHGSFMRSIACPCSWFYLNLNLEKTGNKYLLSENIKRNSNHYKTIPDVCVTLILLFV